MSLKNFFPALYHSIFCPEKNEYVVNEKDKKYIKCRNCNYESVGWVIDIKILERKKNNATIAG